MYLYSLYPPIELAGLMGVILLLDKLVMLLFDWKSVSNCLLGETDVYDFSFS